MTNIENGKKEEIKNALDIVSVIEQSSKLAFPLRLENGSIYRGLYLQAVRAANRLL